MIEPDDWRLQGGQANYLLGRAVRLARWSSDDEGWDHDNCAFCRTPISGRSETSEAYVTADDNYLWICRSCFDDFKETFHWTVVP